MLGLALGPSPALAKGGNGKKMIRALNAFRSSHGLRPLRASARLMRSARSYSDWMARTGYFGHRPNHGYAVPQATFGCFGEILARHGGRGARVRRTLRAWKHSRRHRAVILDPRYEWAGASRARGYFSGAASTVWTVHAGCSAGR